MDLDSQKGFKDKDGNDLKLKDLHPFVGENRNEAIFLMKITDESEYYFSFEIYEVQGWEEEVPGSGEFTIPFDLELYLAGSIKWDGCSNVWFGEEDGYLHLCGKHCFDNHIKLLQELWEFASKRIEKFDYEIAE